jgi:cytidylate kinase
MYRAIAYKALRESIPLSDTETIARLTENTRIELVQSPDGLRVLLDGNEVTSEIRTPEVDRAVGPVCQIPRVREFLVPQQRAFSEKGDLITDGRDQGTVVFPDADLKFFITASLDERARRRKKDQEEKGIDVPMKNLMNDIRQRDRRDSERSHSPLRKADDALLIDTTGMSIEDQIQIIFNAIQQKLKESRH